MDGTTNENPNAKPASPEQQNQFDLLLGRARQLLAATGENVLQAIKASPVQGAVMTGTSIVRKLAMASQQSGVQVDPVVLINVGVQFVKDIAAVANSAGIVPDAQLPAFLKDTLSQSIMQYLKDDAKDGLLSAQDKQRAQGMLAQMQGEQGEPAGEGPGPDNTPGHENAESQATEAQEGAEEDPQGGDEDQMAQELAALRAKKGVAR